MAEDDLNLGEFMGMTKTGAFSRGVGQGVAQQFGDEFIAALKSGLFINPMLKGNQERYKKYRDEIRNSLDAYRERYPGAYTSGEITGGLATGIGSLFLPGGVARVPGTISKIKSAVTTGGGLGGLNALGSQRADKDLGIFEDSKFDPLKTGVNTAIGVGQGAVSDLAFGQIGSSIGKIGQPFFEAIRRKYGKKLSLNAEKTVNEMVEKSGLSMDEVIQKIASGEMVAESNPTLVVLARQLASEDVDIRRKLLAKAEARAKTKGDTAYDSLQTTLAPGSGVNKLKNKREELKKLRLEENKLYDPIWAEGEYVNDEIAEFIKKEVIKRKSYATKALDAIEFENPELSPFFKIAKNGEVSFTNRPPTLQEAEYILRAMKSHTDSLFDNKLPGATTAKRLQAEMQELLDGFSPKLKEARATAAANRTSAKAMEFGFSGLRKDWREVEELFDQLTDEGNEEAIRLLRLGIMGAIDKGMNTRKRASILKDLNDPEKNIHKIMKIIVADDEFGQTLMKKISDADKSGELAKVLNPNFGSQTATLLKGSDAFKQGVSKTLDIGGVIASNNPMEYARFFSQNLGGERKLSINELNEVAKFMVQTNPDQAKKLLTLATTDPKLFKQQLNMLSNSVSRALGKTAAMQAGDDTNFIFEDDKY